MTAELDGLVLQLGVRRGTDFLARALHQQADRVVSREQTKRELWRAHLLAGADAEVSLWHGGAKRLDSVWTRDIVLNRESR